MGKKGTPPKYKTPEQMQTLIDKYFKICNGELLTDDKGKPIFNKWGEPIVINAKPPTVTGLANFLDLTRPSLLNYQGKPEFQRTVERAKSRIEEYVEGRLFDKDGCRGAIFSLTNNFKGWSNNPKADETEETLRKLAEILNRVNDEAQR